ncbi:MAG: hypothetical protein VYE04_10540 [Pseudomonadota bacterium]|nr:hypothetical protein [Pseudomonadota bacterium]
MTAKLGNRAFAWRFTGNVAGSLDDPGNPKQTLAGYDGESVKQIDGGLGDCEQLVERSDALSARVVCGEDQCA